MAIEISVPRYNVNDDAYRVACFHVANGSWAAEGDLLVSLETSKAVIDVIAETEGVVYFANLAVGDRVEVGSVIAVIAEVPVDQPSMLFQSSRDGSAQSVAGEPTISREARRLMEDHGMAPSVFAGRGFVRREDVLAQLAAAQPVARRLSYRDREVDGGDFQEVRARADFGHLRELLFDLRSSLKGRFDRHVPLGTLLGDRLELARDLGMGQGASVYDEVCIFGDVRVGENTWIGPFVVLDGAHARLTIGRNCSIGAGVHVYTHDTIQWALTGGAAEPFAAPTSIGDHCFVAPHCIVAPGTVIGVCSYVAVGSCVQGHFPDHSMIQGNPARLVGRVVVRDGRAALHRF